MPQYDFPPGTTDAEKADFLKDEETRNKGQNPKTQGSFDALNQLTNKIAMGPFSMGQDASKMPSGINRLKWGGIQGAVGGLRGGGLPGALIGGATAAAAPPQSWGDLATSGVGNLLGGVGGAIEKGISNFGGLAKAGIRAGIGAGQNFLDRTIKQASGEESKDNPFISYPASMVAGAGLGAVGDKLSKRMKVGDAMRKLGIPNATGTADNANQMAAEASLPGKMISDEVTQKVTGDVTNAKQRLEEVNKKIQDLVGQKADIVSSGAYSPSERMKLKYVQSQIDSYQKEFGTLSNIPNIAEQSGIPLPTQMKTIRDPQTGKLTSSGPDVLGTAASTKLKELANQRRMIMDGKDPATGNIVQESKMSRDLKLQNLDQQAQSYMDQAKDMKFKMMLDATTRRGQTQVISGDIKKAQLVSQDLQKQINDPGHAFDVDPMLKIFTGDGSGGLDNLKKGLFTGTADNINALQKMYASDPQGVQKMDAVKKVIYGSIFQQAFDKGKDGKSGWTKMNQMLDTDGPWNSAKLEALFGSGPQGYSDANKFKSIVTDLQKFTQPQNKMSLPAIALPAAIGISMASNTPWHTSALAAEGVAGAGTVLMIGIPQIMDKLMTNPKLYDSFHNWVEQGATSEMLKTQPQIRKMIEDLGTKF